MTVTVTTAFDTATGNGTNTAFPFTFFTLDADEVDVYVDDVLQSSGFTVAVDSDNSGGTVTFDTAPDDGAVVRIQSDVSFQQNVSFENSGAFLPSTHDDALDRAAIRDIYLKDKVDRAILVPHGDAATDLNLPAAATRANLFLKFDADGNVDVGSAEGEIGPAPTVTASVTGLAAGASPTVTTTNPSTGTYNLAFGIPAGDTGDTGPAPTLTFGAVTTGDAGTNADVDVTDLGGGAYQLDFTIPRGATGASGALSDADYGDIVVSGSGTVLTIDAGVVTLAKMADMATASLLGRNTAGTGSPEVLSAATAKSLLSLNNVDNTTDANKPVSTAQQAALDLKANLASPTFTGTPAAPTAAERTATTQLATTEFVDRLYDVDQAAKTASYDLVIGDRGKLISTNSNVRVPAYSSVAFPVGSFVEIYNDSNSPITVTFISGSDVFRAHAATSTVTTLTLAARSLGQLRKPSSTTEWLAIGFS